MQPSVVVSAMDIAHLAALRANVIALLQRCAARYDRPGILLDIAPQIHAGAKPYFHQATVRTLDIDQASGADYIADLCTTNRDKIADNSITMVVCTEVLEHVLNPFAAVAEMTRVLEPGGQLFISTPFNFRIHGPLPDCWRFTEHGLRALLTHMEIVELRALATPDRDLMPIHYTVIAEKKRA